MWQQPYIDPYQAPPSPGAKRRKIVLTIFFVVGCLIAAYFIPNLVTQGKVKVITGDTIKISNTKYKLYGVAAPAWEQPCINSKGKQYACGQVAGHALRLKIGDNRVKCLNRSSKTTDKNLAICSVNDENLNAWMVENGYAVAKISDGKDFIPQQTYAQNNKLGLWAGAFEMPWEWKAPKTHSKHR